MTQTSHRCEDNKQQCDKSDGEGENGRAESRMRRRRRREDSLWIRFLMALTLLVCFFPIFCSMEPCRGPCRPAGLIGHYCWRLLWELQTNVKEAATCLLGGRKGSILNVSHGWTEAALNSRGDQSQRLVSFRHRTWFVLSVPDRQVCDLYKVIPLLCANSESGKWSDCLFRDEINVSAAAPVEVIFVFYTTAHPVAAKGQIWWGWSAYHRYAPLLIVRLNGGVLLSSV